MLLKVESVNRMLHTDGMKDQIPARSIAGTMSLALAVLAAVAVVALPIAHADGLPLYRAKRMLFGCWTRYEPLPSKQRFRAFTTRCFHEGRAIGGASMESGGEGGDFCERWRVMGRHLRIWDEYTEQECLLALSDDRQTLTLSNCRAAGEWKFDKQLNRHSWPCRTQ